MWHSEVICKQNFETHLIPPFSFSTDSMQRNHSGALPRHRTLLKDDLAVRDEHA
jgi:hypothetical protein